ncbi:hypothetical protein BN1263540033 [Stenotrophomonas indicatrix]|nr:hypothetical protein BN1263540033 [Stenotrophomonas indicatrix]
MRQRHVSNCAQCRPMQVLSSESGRESAPANFPHQRPPPAPTAYNIGPAPLPIALSP